MVQQRSRVKDLFSLVGYDDSCLAAIRPVKSIIRVMNSTTSKYTLPQRFVRYCFIEWNNMIGVEIYFGSFS